MKKITVSIEGDSKELIFDEPILMINEDPYILVKKATVFWDYNNISSENNEQTYNSVRKVIPEGYMKFIMLKTEIESYGNVTLVENQNDGTCSITSDNAMNMKNFRDVVTMNPNKASPGEELYIDIPKLKQYSLVPRTLHLPFDLKVTNTKSHFMNNFSKMLSKRLQIRFGW